MKTYRYSELNKNELLQLCKRPKMDFSEILEAVLPIIDDVREKGDESVKKFTAKFDGFVPDPLTTLPSAIQVKLDGDTKQAIDTAFRNITRFHKAQLPSPLEVETMNGVRCRRIPKPLDSVGLYIPGGTATLPSTLMMLGIPAMIAGCRSIVVATLPDSEGNIPVEIAYIAQKIGASTILKAGGAQAVAAMAWGTESVPKVDKIFGPGNQYVTAAKMALQNSEAMISIDMPAGPSEVLVIADDSAEPAFVASDLLSQAEHGADSQVVLVATTKFNSQRLKREMSRQLDQLPRKKLAEKALKHSYCIVVETIEQAFEFSNLYAPEHLVVQCRNTVDHIDSIENAGSVFLGPWSPESVGDYASGTNHTLPTYGFARMYSGVTVESFMKFITFQELTKEGLQTIAPTVKKLAEIENLQAHKEAITIRLEKIK